MVLGPSQESGCRMSRWAVLGFVLAVVVQMLVLVLLLTGCTAAQWQAFDEGMALGIPTSAPRIERATIYCVVTPAGPQTVAISSCY